MNKMLALWVSIAISVLLLTAGCGSSPSRDGQAAAEVSEQSMGAGMEGAGEDGGMGASTSAASEGSDWQGNPLENPDSLLATRVIYFEFDQSVVLPEHLDVIRAHADYLVNHPQTMVRLEGHTDQRGTREYNLGLGERRANAVRSLMLAQGVLENQIIVVSYGKERLATQGSDDESMSLNRRVELVY